MIFDVEASQIEALSSTELVELLKKLLHAEAFYSDISLRGVSVPLQINVSDGGEDGRISWIDGLEKTNYLPSRFCIFQAKATDPEPAGWKKEVWTKGSQKKESTRKLNEAVTQAISEHGSYIGFTSALLIGGKYTRRVKAIKEGIQEAGEDPNKLTAIDIYDANKIADWVCQHPAVAIWLNEKQSGLNLRGFQTIERWGNNSDIASIALVEDRASRFLIGDRNIIARPEGNNSADNSLSFGKVKERIFDYFSESGKLIRIIGSSGVGKTRFVYEVLKDENTTVKRLFTISAIYCDFRDIGSSIFSTVQSISEAGQSALFIVDECPRDIAVRLCKIIASEDSQLKIIAIGNDDQTIEHDICLNISVTPADNILIEGIVRQRYPQTAQADIEFIRNLSGGYPRIAVLATDNYAESLPILKSVEDVVNRILVGCGINRDEQVRAIECLSLFGKLGADENESEQLDFVAENLARQNSDEMYEHLARAAKTDLVDGFGCSFILKPLPIAVFLGARRLDLLRVNKILNFIENAPRFLRSSFLNRWQYFDNSTTANKVTKKLLSRDGWCGSLEKLNTEIGSQCLCAIVHIDPDGVADVIQYLYKELSLDDLKESVTRKRELIQVLSKLVSRKRYFYIAAPLLMKLAAIEEEKTYLSNKAANRFKQLFYLQLSATEVEPSERFAILDRGISSGNDKILAVCIDALKNTLKRYYTVFSADYEQIGSRPPIKEWRPEVWGEFFDFYRNGLERLDRIHFQHSNFALKCEQIIASSIRINLSYFNIFEDLKKVLKRISQDKGVWFEAITGVGDWLYFDRNKMERSRESEEYSQQVRQLYDDLMPTDIIQLALFYSKSWRGRIYNPDSVYQRENTDHNYSSNKAKEIAREIAKDELLVYKAIETMVKEELHDAFSFTQELVRGLDRPVEAFQLAVKEFETSTEKKGIQFIRGLLTGIEAEHPESIDKCLQIALKSDSLKRQKANIYTALNISVERLNKIVENLKQGNIKARECVYFSYGRGLDSLDAVDIIPLIDELSSNHGTDGVWSSLEIISMYQYGREELNRQLATKIEQLITSKELFHEIRTATIDSFLFAQLILLVQKHYGIGDRFAVELSNQIVRLCQSDYSQTFSAFDRDCRNIIKLLVEEKPSLLWDVVSRFFETATSLENYNLKTLIRYPTDTFDGKSHNKAGTLFGVPEADIKEWARVNPEVRTPFLCIFYPVLDTVSDDASWHPSLEKLTYDFGSVKEFREALENRFYPSIWSGSMVPYLEIYLQPLQKWFNHPVPEMSYWSKDVYRSLERKIEREKGRRQNKSTLF